MPPLRRWLTVALAIGGAVAFALAVQGSSWWTIGDDVGIGTVSSRHCFGEGGCQTTDLGWTGGSTTWVRAGAATYAAGLVAALVLVALAGSIAARSSGRLAARVAAVATVTAAVVGVAFVVTSPDVPGSSLGRGLPLFGGAVALAIATIVSALWPARGAQAPAPGSKSASPS